MPRVSVNILTKNRAALLRSAVQSVLRQSFTDFEIVIVNDGSTDNTEQVVEEFINDGVNIIYLKHPVSLGIIKSRQDALLASGGEYIAVLDDDDEWVDKNKLKKQMEFFQVHPQTVLVGGGIETGGKKLFRVQSDQQIRKTMLLRNNFFTSTAMFKKDIAVKAGGFFSDDIDLAEDYDLWLRIGKLGQMYNFRDVFVKYRSPGYNRDKFKQFLRKQLALIKREKHNYPNFFWARLLLKLRIFF